MINIILKDGTEIRFPSEFVVYKDIPKDEFVVYREMRDPDSVWTFKMDNIEYLSIGGERII